MRDRIRQIMEAKHMTQQTFANFIGMSAGSLSGIFNNRTEPTLKTVRAIKSKIPELSTEWLMFGNGPMYESDQQPARRAEETAATNPAEPTLDFGSDSTVTRPATFEGSKQQGYGRQQPQVQPLKPEIRYIDRPQRQITEIRVFFDDGTYETFSPKK